LDEQITLRVVKRRFHRFTIVTGQFVLTRQAFAAPRTRLEQRHADHLARFPHALHSVTGAASFHECAGRWCSLLHSNHHPTSSHPPRDSPQTSARRTLRSRSADNSLPSVPTWLETASP